MRFPELLKNNRVLSILISVALIILAVNVIGNKIIGYKIENWEKTLNERISETEKTVIQIFNYKQNKLLLKKNNVLDHVKKLHQFDAGNLFEVFAKSKTGNLALAVLDSSFNPVVWNAEFLTELLPLHKDKHKPNEIFSSDTQIANYLAVIDTIGKATNLKLFCAEVIEKKYKLSKEYFESVSITREVEKEIETEIEFHYKPQSTLQTDKLKHSFNIRNNFNNIIARATFVKPTQAKTIEEYENYLFTAESILALFGYLLLGFVLFGELKNRKSGILIFTVTVFYLTVFRYLLIYLNLPQSIFTSDLLNGNYYSTQFGKGIAKSPLDLTITFMFLFIVSYLSYRLSFFYFERKKNLNGNKIQFAIIVILTSIIYVLIFRGFSAGVRGIIFDSSIRYFQSTALTPTFPQFVMHINLLLFGISFVLVSVAFVFVAAANYPYRNKENNSAVFLLVALFLISAIVFFTFIQSHPLNNIFIKLAFVIGILVFTYLIIEYDIKTITRTIGYFLIGSVLSIVSLLHFNSELERNSLKTIANLVTRANDKWYKEIIAEELNRKEQLEKAEEAFSRENINFDKYAFVIWSNSKLQEESINSSVNFISPTGELLGGFGSVYPKTVLDLHALKKGILFTEEKEEKLSQKLIRGIKPVVKNNKLLGYIDISILSDINDLSFDSHPKFISSGKLSDVAILSLEKIKILDYQNGILKNVYGEVNPSDEINNEILNADYGSDNDTWLEADFNSGRHLIYAKKTNFNNIERILAVGLRNKDLSFNLFDFFKIFFSHSIVLLIILLAFIAIQIKRRREYLFDLRTQLLISFLIISLLPLIFLALYFRNLTEQKNDSAIYYKLGKRAFNVETYVNEHAKNILSLDSVFVAASRDLNVNYSIFNENKIAFSSQDLLYDVGLIPTLIHPYAYKKIILNGSQEVLIKDQIDKYKFNTFYYKANLLEKEYIIKVADAFNKILLPLSGTEVDVFLFGTYSLAMFLVILLSAYLANRISKPVRELTFATKAVAQGDLNLELEAYSKGEIKELVEGFQYMVKEIKKNQAMLAEIEREEAWKEMAKQVAHEIKNPLTPMKLSIQQLITAYKDKSDKFDNFFAKVTTMLLNQIETLRNIATEFSHFARMPKLKVENINCNLTIKQAINLFTDEKIKIEFDALKTGCMINADAEQLRRTLVNLIRNSIQAGASEIIITLDETENKYILRITDNGKGIKKEYLDKIFEPNFTTKQEGMGLGLSMARRYLNNINGSIDIEETGIQGTTIKITLQKTK